MAKLRHTQKHTQKMELKFNSDNLIIQSEDFDIEQIANSGQCFRINNLLGNIWQVVAFGRLLKIEKLKHNTHKLFCSEKEFKEIWKSYFDFETDYGRIKSDIQNLDDPYLTKAIEHGKGIRILRQDLFETIISFIISQQNNIPRIKSSIEKLCRPYGAKFPGAEILATYSERDFQNLGFGYRSKYLRDISVAVQNGDLNLDNLKKMDYDAAIKYLKGFKGIGDKVANCIALYGLHKTEAFPKDVWINRIIKEVYNGKFDISQLSNCAGIVQQYMFFYQRFLQQRKSG